MRFFGKFHHFLGNLLPNLISMGRFSDVVRCDLIDFEKRTLATKLTTHAISVENFPPQTYRENWKEVVLNENNLSYFKMSLFPIYLIFQKLFPILPYSEK